MPCYKIDPAMLTHDRCTVTGATATHLLTVLRKHCGETLALTDGAGMHWSGMIVEKRKRTLTIQITATMRTSRPGPDITVAAAVLPQDRWRYVMEKCVELGAGTIIPLLTARTQRRKSHVGKQAHWQGIADQAAEQSGRLWWPTVAPLTDWQRLISTCGAYDYRLCARPELPATRLAYAIPAGRVLILIGPEGGLTADEIRATEYAGVFPLYLGPLTLRAETAAVVALTTVQLSQWQGGV
ncbi:MAG: 16S rRNA (uracil(1498)-N(3))-methyltransferase [Deltaproteobacteria bacterium]|nr:16S rRNA (uracil(1498)-N(3))-methyltransferase [Deltaproteobacteria bacterium]